MNSVRHVPLDTSRIGSIRMGTTVATNALLERAGEKTQQMQQADMMSKPSCTFHQLPVSADAGWWSGSCSSTMKRHKSITTPHTTSAASYLCCPVPKRGGREYYLQCTLVNVHHCDAACGHQHLARLMCDTEAGSATQTGTCAATM